jgi:prepilin-type N-terminal cleavage/methylation domain-containing protein/prepilin-type processing-associated H-X9-DG protein
MKTRQSGFTLIELLAVVAIIGVLAALVTSQVGKAIDKSKATSCLNNMRQLGAAAMAYGADNNMQFPGSVHGKRQGIKSWRVTLPPYFLSDKDAAAFSGVIDDDPNLKTFQCPCDKDKKRHYTYIINDYLDMTSSARVRSPAATFLFAEAVEGYDTTVDHFHFSEYGDIGPSTFAKDVEVKGHADGANYLFADGHVEYLTWKVVQQRISAQDSEFVSPGIN